MISPAQHVAIAAVAFLGMAANAIAGGGMLLTFPALIGLGVPSLMANATSTVALWPGSVASMLGYRDELRGARAWALHFFVPSLLGGLIGGILLTMTSQQRFDAIVPWLVLIATILFLFQQPVIAAVRRWSGTHPHARDPMIEKPPRAFIIFHFFVAIYGGYFGGGAGLIMLAAFGLMGLTNIHQMNGLKNFFAVTFNLVAIGAFIWKGLVDWPIAATMAVGSVAGGIVASRLAQRVPQKFVRGAVSVIGFVATLWLFLQRH
jgi:uncharacterized membrane protein YfcA